MVYAFALRLTGIEADAAELTQETFARAFEGFDRFRGDSKVSTWLMGITYNLARKLYRRRKMQPLTENMPDLPGEDDPEREAAGRQMARILTVALGKLPKKQRRAVIARTYGMLSFAEIAVEIGGSETAARVNYHHGLRRLRDELKRMGVDGL